MKSFRNGIQFTVLHCWNLRFEDNRGYCCSQKENEQQPSKYFSKLSGNKQPERRQIGIHTLVNALEAPSVRSFQHKQTTM